MALSESALPEAITDLVTQVRLAKLPPAARRRRIREDAKVSMRQVARTLGVDVMTVSRWEDGATPTPEHAIAYRQLLDALEEAVAS
jgi:DNA-binding transcriptional regulator YiaG